jgi:hypothetical protein
MERFVGDRARSALSLTSILIWLALTIVFLAELLPTYFCATKWVFPIFLWAGEVSVAFLIADRVVEAVRASGIATRLRWIGRVSLLVLILVLAAGEYHTRSYTLVALRQQTLRVFTKLGVTVPDGSMFRAEYGAASEGLPSFEHPASSPSCNISTVGNGWKVEAYYTGYRLWQVVIDGSVSKGVPRTVDEARKILRECPPITNLPMNSYSELINYGKENGDKIGSWGLGYTGDKNKRVKISEGLYLDPSSCYIEVASDGKLTLVLRTARFIR